MAQIERRFKAHRGAGLLFLGRATVSARGVAIIGGKAAPSFSQATEVRSRPCGSASLPVQAKCCLPGLLRRELLGPRAHQCCGPRVAGVALKRIAPEEGPSAADADRLLGDRDDHALHGDVRRPGAYGDEGAPRWAAQRRVNLCASCGNHRYSEDAGARCHLLIEGSERCSDPLCNCNIERVGGSQTEVEPT